MAENIKTDLITLSRHVLQDQFQHKEARGDLTLLLVSIQLGCKFVSSCVRKAGLANLTGLASSHSENYSGDQQKKLDVLANEIFIKSLASSGRVKVMVSEEDEEPIIVSEATGASYCVVFDPLDGSSNIDAGVSIGTIFGIYKIKPGSSGSVQDVLRPGKDMVAAGYCMYGSSTNFVLTTGHAVHGYTLDPSIGEFILTHPNIRVPSRGKVYSVNEGNSVYWTKACAEYVKSIKFPPQGNAPYAARYVGSMVADVHRTFLYGGIFLYPADKKSKTGKLRVLYECFPMAMLMEAAGGKATTGTQRVLDLCPTTIHERAPIFLGSKEDVEDVEKFYQQYPDEQ